MTNARQIETVKNCMNPKCGKSLEIFVRVDDKMFCSIGCASEEGSLKDGWNPDDVKIISKRFEAV